MSTNQPEEVDIFYILKKIKEAFKKLNKLFFNAVNFVVKRWIVIALLILAGAGYGYYVNKTTTKNKTAKLLVRINFDTVNYVYTTIELLNEKLIEKDTAYFKKAGFPEAIGTIKGIELKPLVRIKEIVDQYEINNRNFESVLKNVDFESVDEEFDLANTFTVDYKQHIMVVSLGNNATPKTLQELIKFINNSELLGDLKNKKIENLTNQIAENKVTIAQIDNILDFYAKNNSIPTSSEKLFVVAEMFDIPKAIEKKSEVLKEIDQLDQELVYAKDVVIVLNKPTVTFEEEGITDNKLVFYPLLLVGLFLLLAFVRYIFLTLKRMAEED